MVYRESTKLKKRMVSVPSLSRGKDCIVVLELSKGQSALCCMSAVVHVCVTHSIVFANVCVCGFFSV